MAVARVAAPRTQASPERRADLGRRARFLPSPRVLRPRRRARPRGDDAVRDPAAAPLGARGDPGTTIRARRTGAVVPNRALSERTRADRRPLAQAPRRHHRNGCRDRRRGHTRNDRRARALDAVGGGTRAPAPPGAGRAPADLEADREHPAQRGAHAVRAGGRDHPAVPRPRVLHRRAREHVPRLRRCRAATAVVSDGSVRQRVPRPARRGRRTRAPPTPLRGDTGGAGRRTVGRGSGVRARAGPRAYERAHSRRRARKHRRAAARNSTQGEHAVTPTDDRRPAATCCRAGDSGRHLPRAPRGPRRRGRRSRGRHEPVGRLHLRTCELSDLRREPRRARPAVLLVAVPRAGHAVVEPGDAGPLSDRVDVQADRRRGSTRNGVDHAVLEHPLHRLAHGRKHRVPQRRAGDQREPQPRPGAHDLL